jgi:hypothetical protein
MILHAIELLIAFLFGLVVGAILVARVDAKIIQSLAIKK